MAQRTTAKPPFSHQLENWLNDNRPKTIDGLSQVFAEKSFAVVFLVLMALPALPLPTAGVSHVFEIIVMLLALELIAGQRSIWLRESWRHKPLSKLMLNKGLPLIIRRVRQLERWSRPRLGGVLSHTVAIRLIGLLVFALTLAAFVSPVFSGLDTIPSLGVVFIALGLILDDIVGVIVGTVIGAIGVAVLIGLGAGIYKLIF